MRISTSSSLNIGWLLSAILFPAVIAAQPARVDYGRAEYYRAPQIGLMVGFIKDPQHGGYTVDDWRKGIGAKFDARAIVARVKASGAAHIIWYDKWIDGLVFRKTKTTNYHTDRDFLAELMKECKREKVRLLTYFNTFYDGNPEFAQWACLDQRGQRIAYPPPWPANALSIYSPYREKVLEQIRELIEDYDVDGVWLDVPQYPPFAFDRWTKEAFEKRYQKLLEDATAVERRRFAIDSVSDWNKDVVAFVHKLKPSAVVTTNAIVDPLVVGPRTAIGLAEPFDFYSTELHLLERQFRIAENLGRYLKPYEALTMISDTWFSPIGSGPPPTSKKPSQMPLEMATVLSGGMNLYLALTLGHDGTTDEASFTFLDVSGQWLRRRRAWLEGAEGVHDAGIVLGTADPSDLDWPGGTDDYSPAVVKIEESLRSGGYLPRRFLNCRQAVEWGRIAPSIRVLVVPDRVSLAPEDSAVVERFVRGGGKVIAFGRGLALGKSGSGFSAAPLFGVRNMGAVRIARGSIEWSGGKTLLTDPLFHLRPETAEVMLWAGSPPAGVTPVLTRNRAGDGVAYACALPESALFGEPKLLDFLWKEIVGDPFFRLSDTTGRYFVRIRRQGSRHVVHVLDKMDFASAGGVRERFRAAYHELSINTRLLPFQRATLVPENLPLASTSSGNWKTLKIYPNPEIMIALE